MPADSEFGPADATCHEFTAFRINYFGFVGVPTGPLAGFLTGSLAPGLFGGSVFFFFRLASSSRLYVVLSPGFWLGVAICACPVCAGDGGLVVLGA